MVQFLFWTLDVSAYLAHRAPEKLPTEKRNQGAPSGSSSSSRSLLLGSVSFCILGKPLTSFPVLLPSQVLSSTEASSLHGFPPLFPTYAIVVLHFYITLLSGPLPSLQTTLYNVATEFKKKVRSPCNPSISNLLVWVLVFLPDRQGPTHQHTDCCCLFVWDFSILGLGKGSSLFP